MLIHTIKFRLLVICMSIFLATIALTSLLLYNDIKRSTIEQELEESSYSLAMAIANVDRDYTQVIQFMNWNSNTTEINNFLTRPRVSAFSQEYYKVMAYNTAQKQLSSLAIIDVVEKVMISNLEEDYIAIGNGYGNVSDWRLAQPYFNRQPELEFTVADTPFEHSLTPRVIIFSGRMYMPTGSDVVGFVDVFLSTNIIARQFSPVRVGDGSRSFVVIDGSLHEILEGRLSGALAGGDAIWDASFTARENGVRQGSGKFADYSGSFLIARSDVNGWVYIKTAPGQSRNSLTLSSFRTIYWIGGILLLCAIFLVYVLSRMINRPVARICHRIDLVAEGDFSRDVTIETADEFGYIGKGVNEMSGKIEDLIYTSLETEREKKNYEFKVLQSQISPHFLYNTLNSIKWMASLQKADGIVEMTATLGRMLRRILHANGEIITLEEELGFIKDYVVIQQYRYGGMFQVRYGIEDEALLRARLIKFTLQPLVENAIFHGIDPKNSAGTITLTARALDGALIIEIHDDGVGIPPHKLESLNAFNVDDAEDKGNIGLSNIHQRIQLEYGRGYGLRIDSALGEYTRVTVRVPLTPAPGTGGGGAGTP